MRSGSYEFANAIDELNKDLDAEIKSPNLANTTYTEKTGLEKIRTNLGLLAICVTGSYTNKENELINLLITDCHSLSNKTLIGNCSQLIAKLQTLILNYKNQKSVPSQKQDVQSIIASINAKTKNFTAFFPKPQEKNENVLSQNTDSYTTKS